MTRFFALLLCTPFYLPVIYGLNILGLFPHPGVSHFHFFHPIMRGLAEAGHDVTIISFFPDKNPPSLYKDIPLAGLNNLSNSVDLVRFENRRFYNHFLEFFMIHEWGQDACKIALESDALAEVLKSAKKYDVIIMEQFNTDCLMGVAYILKAPVVALHSCALMPWHYDRIGNPHIPSYIPGFFIDQSEKMDFFHRVSNWISIHAMKFLYNYYSTNFATAIVRSKFGDHIPDIGELVKETSLFFVNQHYSLSGAKPLSPAVIELGGIHIQKSKPLPEDIQQLLDSAENGVVYISWGSMIKATTLPIEKRDAILRSVGRLKQQILWKWENVTLPNKPNNVHVRQWMPQKEILCHPNVKVFVSHGGLMGTTEAAYCGVPVVVTPMYGDQFLNAAALVHRGMGNLLHYEEITETTVFKAIKKALDPKSMDAAKVVSFSFKNRPQKVLDTAIWWVEHVASTNGSALTKSISTYLPWYVYYSLDVYFLFAAIMVICIGSWVCFKWVFCRRTNRNNGEKKDQ